MFNQQAAYQQGQGQYIKQEHQGGNYGANGGGYVVAFTPKSHF